MPLAGLEPYLGGSGPLQRKLSLESPNSCVLLGQKVRRLLQICGKGSRTAREGESSERGSAFGGPSTWRPLFPPRKINREPGAFFDMLRVYLSFLFLKGGKRKSHTLTFVVSSS